MLNAYTQGYGTTMNVLNVVLPGPLARKASPHATVALLAVFAAFFYRDVWPLVTFDLVPLDRTTPILWTQIGMAAAGAFLPAFEPYAYVPIDPLVRYLFHPPDSTLTTHARRTHRRRRTRNRRRASSLSSSTSSWMASSSRPRGCRSSRRTTCRRCATTTARP
jgi:hypothetical protein